jgi:hypothetical protein
MLGYLFKTPDHTTMSANFLPPDITHENKGVGGSKEGDTKVQYVVFTFVLCYIAHYTPLVGLAVERTAAFVFLVLPVAADRGSAILAEVMEGATTYYERYGQSMLPPHLLKAPCTDAALICSLLVLLLKERASAPSLCACFCCHLCHHLNETNVEPFLQG